MAPEEAPFEANPYTTPRSARVARAEPARPSETQMDLMNKGVIVYQSSPQDLARDDEVKQRYLGV